MGRSEFQIPVWFISNGDESITSRYGGRIEDRRVAVVASSTDGVAEGVGKQRMACMTVVRSGE